MSRLMKGIIKKGIVKDGDLFDVKTHDVKANWWVLVVEFPIDIKCSTKQSLEASFYEYH